MSLKKCPYCAEEILEAAVKCRYCGEFLTEEGRSSEKIVSEIRPSYAGYWGFWLGGALTLVLGVGLVIFLYIYLDRRCKKYTVTDKRVVSRKGILTRSVDEVSISHIRSMNVKQSFVGRLFNFGDIFIGTAGTSGVEVTLESVKGPVRFKELIMAQAHQGQTAID